MRQVVHRGTVPARQESHLAAQSDSEMDHPDRQMEDNQAGTGRVEGSSAAVAVDAADLAGHSLAGAVPAVPCATLMLADASNRSD